MAAFLFPSCFQMNDIELAELELKIAQLEKRLQEFRRQKDFEKAGKVIDLLESLEERYDREKLRLRREAEMRELDDFYDDEKNRDRYNEIVTAELLKGAR
jgi:predicted nucleic acid-binding protein